MTNQQATCAERIADQWESTKEDLEIFVECGFCDIRDSQLEDETRVELGNFWDYALDMSYIEPDTFDDQPEGYYRWQISWGGPSSEIRFMEDGFMEYWFLDWWDGAKRDVTNEPCAKALAQHLQDCECMPLFNDIVRF